MSTGLILPSAICKVLVSQSARGGEGSPRKARGTRRVGRRRLREGGSAQKEEGPHSPSSHRSLSVGPPATAQSLPLPQLFQVTGARGAATCGVVSRCDCRCGGGPGGGARSRRRDPLRERGRPDPRPAARGPPPRGSQPPPGARGLAAVPRAPRPRVSGGSAAAGAGGGAEPAAPRRRSGRRRERQELAGSTSQ